MTTEQRSGVKALLRDYRHYAGATLWLALALMILGALAEGIGILMLVPLAAVAVDVESSDFLDSVPGLASGLSVDQRFWLALLVFVGAMALRSALTYARDLRLARLLAGYEASLRLRAAATLARRGWSFAGGIGQAGMQSLLLTDVPRSGLAVSQAQQFAVAAVLIVVQLALAAAFLSLRFAALALAILAVASLFSIGFMRRGVRSGMALVRRSEESTGSGFRLHAGLKAAQAQGTVAQFLAEYRVSLTGACEESVRFSRDLSLSRSLAFLASAVAAGLLVLVGYRVLGLGFPVLVASLVLFARTAAPVQQLQQAAHNVTAYAPSFAAIERRLGKLEPGAVQAVPHERLEWRKLEVRNVALLHRPGFGVRDVSLELASGEWIGIGGPSGGGKTTLLDLIAGLLVPQAGTVSVDAQPLSGERLEQWRMSLAYVGQEGSVFDDSVRGNLGADSGVTADDELWSALEIVGLDQRVRGFAGGLDERVGDRGSALSGGERQRLAIARALLRKPSLLILDEATSALDAAGESALLGRLRALEPRPAALIVAHRPSTLAHCDSAITIQHGAQEKAAN